MIVAPVRERGLKSSRQTLCRQPRCRSREGAWIEIFFPAVLFLILPGRSREGAWIEILDALTAKAKEMVAPVRERGLKLILSEI